MRRRARKKDFAHRLLLLHDEACINKAPNVAISFHHESFCCHGSADSVFAGSRDRDTAT